MSQGHNEAFSRVLIDRALLFSGWDLIDPRQVQFELHTSNGREHWFWNFERADQRDAYRIERLPSREDLERVRLKNLQPPRPLESEIVTPEYLRKLKHDLTLRQYQIEAMDEIARSFDREGKRKFLLEMATGTGKTLLCAA